MAQISTELSFLVAFSFVICFFLLLNYLGLPSEYQLVSTFDFLWLAGGMIGIGAACTLITGVACVIGGAVWGVGTLITYIGVGFLTANPDSTLTLIKGFFFTPLTMGITYIESKLARGGG
jgi:hypothetical protein